ncbi:MAG TPA: hypothetical protein P5307_17195 [Pirellulaceae bacterium]|nr:hypothetical protein [Planctomycetales bacterium]MCB9941321.1 hypothetical protein [Planctomycetaceae bacterium]HRX80811.1 hypothetical protein [Pirellulaceae bacterium]
MHRRHLLVIFSLCYATTGCTTLTPNLSDVFSVSNGQATKEFKSSEVPSPDLSTPPDVPSFVVEMRGSSNQSQKFKRPLTDEATYVQGVLVQSNALKHFGRVKIELWRQRPDGQGYHKLDIPYDRKAKMVPPGFDYAIHEGDRLIFMEDDTSVLDDMLQSLGK